MERDSSKNKALEQGARRDSADAGTDRRGGETAANVRPGDDSEGAHGAQDDAVRTEGPDSRRTEGAMAGAAAARGGNPPKVYHRRTDLNDGLRLMTDVEVMVMSTEGSWRKAEVTAFWDTGSTWTSISKRLADRLGAPLTDSEGVSGIGSWQESWQTMVNLRLGDIVIPWERVEVVDYHGSLRPDLVIGMTTILKGRLEVTMDCDDIVLTFEL